MRVLGTPMVDRYRGRDANEETKERGKKVEG